MATQAEPATTITSTPSVAAPSQSVKVCPSPLQLLDKLEHMIGSSGCIKSSNDVAEFVKVMQMSQFLVSRCILLNVLKSTRAPSTLLKFMESGGWKILNMWVAEAKKVQNNAILVELLQVLQRLPVTVTSLKQGNMGKLIKQLSKSDSQEVKTLASDLLTKWMAIFKGQTSSAAPSKSTTDPLLSTTTIAMTEERRPSVGGSDDDPSNPTTPTKNSKTNGKREKSEKKSSGKKKESKLSKSANTPPVEASQLPPGPMVALGKPKDRLTKRQRDSLLQKGGHPPPEKKTKGNSDPQGSKGPKESEGFMAFLSNQAMAATKLKEKKVKKVPKAPKLSRTNSTTSDTGDPKQEVTTPTIDMPPVVPEDMEARAPPSDEMLNKKRVSWASDDNLTIVHYFEMDESERVNVNRAASFLAAAQQEKMMEREALESGLMFSRDRLVEMIPWQRPTILDSDIVLPPRGESSKERERQMEREGKVLAQLFLNKSSVQPSPVEPDPETDVSEQEPKLIPMNEPGAPTSQQPMFPPPSLALPPGHVPPESPLLSPGSTIHQAQSLINYYENSKGNGDPMQGANGHFPQPPPNQGGSYNYQGNPPGQYMNHEPPPGMRGGLGEFRGMNRGAFRRRTGLDSKICKHFLTHGCRRGSKCRFLHCSPEDLANKMSINDQKPMRGFRGGRGSRGRGRGAPWGRGGGQFHPSGPPFVHEQHDQQMDTFETNNSNPSEQGPIATNPT